MSIISAVSSLFGGGGASSFLSQAASLAFGYLAAQEQRKTVQDQIDFKKDAIKDAVATLTECCEAFPLHGTEAEVFGAKPLVSAFSDITYEPVLYNKILLCAAAVDAAICNCDNFTKYSELTTKANDYNREEDLKRINSALPHFSCANEKDGANTCDLAKGILPFDDAMELVHETVQFQNTIGTPGCISPIIAQDLGVKRLELQAEGHSRLKSRVDMQDDIHGKQGQMDIRENFVFAVDMYNSEAAQELAHYQAEYKRVTDQYKNRVYNEQMSRKSEQDQYNVDAAPDPAKRGMSLQALECCYTKAATQAALASINTPILAAKDSTFGLLSDFFGGESGESFISSIGDGVSNITTQIQKTITSPLSSQGTIDQFGK